MYVFKDQPFTYDLFEVCPACDEWRMRVRVKGSECVDLSGMAWLTEWYSFELRCLNCGYSKKYIEVGPRFFEAKLPLSDFLKSERRRLQAIGVATERCRERAKRRVSKCNRTLI